MSLTPEPRLLPIYIFAFCQSNFSGAMERRSSLVIRLSFLFCFRKVSLRPHIFDRTNWNQQTRTRLSTGTNDILTWFCHPLDIYCLGDVNYVDQYINGRLALSVATINTINNENAPKHAALITWTTYRRENTTCNVHRWLWTWSLFPLDQLAANPTSSARENCFSNFRLGIRSAVDANLLPHKPQQ